MVDINAIRSLEQQLKQEKEDIEQSIKQRHLKKKYLEQRVDESRRQMSSVINGVGGDLRAKLTMLEGKLNAREVMVNQSRNSENLSQATVQDFKQKLAQNKQHRSEVFNNYEAEMVQLSEELSRFSLVCTAPRLRNSIGKVKDDLDQLTQKLNDTNLQDGGNDDVLHDEEPGHRLTVEDIQAFTDVYQDFEIDSSKIEEIKQDIISLCEEKNKILMSNE